MKETEIKNIISKVYKGSIAEEAGIEIGDQLLKINGNKIEDIIEYKYYLADKYLEIEILKSNGEDWLVEVDKEYDEDLGIEFENPIIDRAKTCKNKCIFCFIDQLPPDMRPSLYFKDDDSRLSFLQGNYITLTNMSEEDIDKIIRYRISPINISVHTTNGELRKQMLNNRFAGNILEVLGKLAENHIQMNCQIVLCPDINDKQELDSTIEDLGKLSKSIGSVAIVPIGLTAYREGLRQIQPFNEASALYVINQVENWQRQFKKSIGRNFVHVSDEFYILAKKDFPPFENYEGFPQLENGVGLVIKFQREFYDYLKRLSIALKRPRYVTVVTGTAAYDIIKRMCHDLTEKIKNLKVEAICVENKFFGGHISVSGLITGQDIYRTLKDKHLGNKLILPESMMKAGEEVFLDDYTVTMLEAKLGVPIEVSEVEGKKFIKTIVSSKKGVRGCKSIV